MRDDFFVLWRDHDGGAHRSWLRGFALATIVGAGALGAVLVALQRTVDAQARFEYGTVRSYEGVLVGEPVPLLATSDRVYFLVDPLKHAFDPAAREHFTGRTVRLQATLIERGEQAMLEVRPASVVEIAAGEREVTIDVGPAEEGVVLRGEIVDSKCYLGVMNPGHLKPHRACAINCLRGGIPPVLLYRDGGGGPRQAVLVAADGGALADWILPFVAEPVEIRGTMRTIGPITTLAISPADVSRIPARP